MQTIQRIMTVTGSVGAWTSEFGEVQKAPELAIGIQAKLRIDLRCSTKDKESKLLPLDAASVASDSFYFALDSDYIQETDPKLLRTSGITVTEEAGRIYLDAEIPNTAVPGLIAAVGSSQTVTLNGEIGGYSGENGASSADFLIQFSITIRNRIYLGGDVPPDIVNDPEYLTAAQIKALIAEATRPPKGDKGDPGLSAYQIAVAGGYKGTVIEWLASLHGTDGKSAYQVAVDGGYAGTEAEWLASLKGSKGDPGKNAYEIAVQLGYIGTVAEWLEDLRGAPGQDLKFDATGKVTDLAAFGNARAGFTFGATVTDAVAKCTKLQIYVKKSDALNDWYDPLVITYFGTFNTALMPPMEFTKKPASAEYYSFDLTKHSATTVACVCVDTADGELRLPYNSATGITKMVKKDGTMKVWFGELCPEFQSGRIYFSQGYIKDTAGEPETPVEGSMYYGYIPTAAAGGVYKVSEITKAMITAAGEAMKSSSAVTLGKTSIGTVPEGALVAVLIPAAAANLTATKFDGISGKTAFALNNGVTSTGANGADVTLDGVAYKVYGEFKLAAAEVFIYVD